MCLSGENGKSEFLPGKSAVRQSCSVYLSSGGSGGSWGWSFHSGSHCTHHSTYIQVNLKIERIVLNYKIHFPSLLTFVFYLNMVCDSRLFVRRKSKQAMRDYKKVQIQLENLETSVRDRCKKEFTGRVPFLLFSKNLICIQTKSTRSHF